MKRYFILLFFILGSLCLSAQHNLDPKPITTEQQAIGTAKKTSETATYKGIEYPVYVGTRGGKFIVYLNSKGHWSKKYLPKS